MFFSEALAHSRISTYATNNPFLIPPLGGGQEGPFLSSWRPGGARGLLNLFSCSMEIVLLESSVFMADDGNTSK